MFDKKNSIPNRQNQVFPQKLNYAAEKIKSLPQKHNTQIKKTETLYIKFVKSVPEEQINDQIIRVCEFYNLYIQAERERERERENSTEGSAR